MCARAQSLGDIVSNFGDEFFSSLASAVQSEDPTACTDAIQHYTRATSYVTHNDGQPHDLRGGILLSSCVEAKFNQCFSYCYPTPFGPVCEDKCDGNNTFITYEFEFGLTDASSPFPSSCPPSGCGDGILTVKPKKRTLNMVGDLAWVLQGIVQDKIEQEVPKQVEAKALEQQRQDVLGGSAIANCNVLVSADEEQCDAAASQFTLYARLGASKLGFDSSQQDALEATIQQEKNGRLTNWECVKHATGADLFAGRCEFVIRAKRVNVYPDQVELVWFDSPDLASTAFAAYAATFAPSEGDSRYADAVASRAELCAYDPSHGIDPFQSNWSFERRSFANFADDYRVANHTGSFCFRDPGGW